MWQNSMVQVGRMELSCSDLKVLIRNFHLRVFIALLLWRECLIIYDLFSENRCSCSSRTCQRLAFLSNKRHLSSLRFHSFRFKPLAPELPSLFERLLFDLFSSLEDLFALSKVHIGRGDVVQGLVIPQMVVTIEGNELKLVVPISFPTGYISFELFTIIYKFPSAYFKFDR